MQTLVLVVYLLICLAIIGLIMLQQGKGAEAGASFGGGASQTVFGSQGGGNFFSRLTTWLAAVFFVLAFGLTYLAKQQSTADLIDPSLLEAGSSLEAIPQSDIPSVELEEESSDIPVVEDAANDAENTASESDIPTVIEDETSTESTPNN
ncbi:preprotein translocase subunit SecG [Sessilibacter sp. MAH2]